jgi:hypothetical protein
MNILIRFEITMNNSVAVKILQGQNCLSKIHPINTKIHDLRGRILLSRHGILLNIQRNEKILSMKISECLPPTQHRTM